MTPKEKAVDIIGSMYEPYFNRAFVNISNSNCRVAAKICALKTVNEILASFEAFMDSRSNFRHELEIEAGRYWLAVKTEIEKS